MEGSVVVSAESFTGIASFCGAPVPWAQTETQERARLKQKKNRYGIEFMAAKSLFPVSGLSICPNY